MKIAVLADIHGNLPALRAVLGDVDAAAPDALVVAGDIVAGPLVRECLDAVDRRPEPTYWISGNSERDAVRAFDGAPTADDPRAAPRPEPPRRRAPARSAGVVADLARPGRCRFRTGRRDAAGCSPRRRSGAPRRRRLRAARSRNARVPALAAPAIASTEWRVEARRSRLADGRDAPVADASARRAPVATSRRSARRAVRATDRDR